MIDHFGLAYADYDAAKAFFTAALAPLGVRVMMEVDAKDNPSGAAACGFGRDKPDFWVGGEGRTTPRTHIAFTARTRAEVDAFHAAALAAGGTDNGAPGIRAQYHPNYYAAFVYDPDGHNVEAVCHAAE